MCRAAPRRAPASRGDHGLRGAVRSHSHLLSSSLRPSPPNETSIPTRVWGCHRSLPLWHFEGHGPILSSSLQQTLYNFHYVPLVVLGVFTGERVGIQTIPSLPSSERRVWKGFGIRVCVCAYTLYTHILCVYAYTHTHPFGLRSWEIFFQPTAGFIGVDDHLSK